MLARMRRLVSDHQRLLAWLEGNARFRLLDTEGNPPERYRLEVKAAGLVLSGEHGPEPCSTHRVEVFLPLDYPRRAPVCRMLSPVFHPNIDPQKICIGDHWNAGQSLPHLIVRIAEMICFQSYNTKSPLNAEAAAWAETNPHRLPLERGDFSVGL